MERRKKALICLGLLVSLVLPRVKIVKAEALPNEVLEGTATVADIVMSYYAESGSAVTNTDWINTLYNDLGTNFGTIEDLAEQGLLVLNENTGYWESTASLGTAIENTSAYASLHLNEIFNVSAEEATQLGGGAVAATGGTILGSACAGVASIGTIPLLGAVTASYWAGIGIGTIIAHKLGLYGDSVSTGTYITQDQMLSNVPLGNTAAIYQGMSANGSYNRMYYGDAKLGYVFIASENVGNQYYFLIYKPNVTNFNFYLWDTSLRYNPYTQSKRLTNGVAYSLESYNENYPSSGFSPIIRTCSNLTDFNAFIDGLRNGSIPFPSIKSPDLIGQNGNLEGQYDSNSGYTIPDMLPQIDPSVEAGKPLRLQDWLNFANQANTNTGGGQPDLNKDLFEDIIDRIVSILSPDPNPDPGPSPDPGGQTRPVPTPTPVPDPDYDVPQPEQPEWQSETTQQTEEVPDSIPTGKPWVVEGLQNKFPFCIPWDIKNMLGKFSSASRQAPYISWRFNPPFTPIDYTFQVDLADFEDAAAILRTLELIAFIVGLAFATRYLIGAT